MLGLLLRQEFNEKRFNGTEVELVNKNDSGATHVSPADFFKSTYPTIDILRGIEAVCKSDGRPFLRAS